MRKLTFATTLTALAAAMSLTTTAHADGNPDGHFQVKVLATAVLTSGDIDPNHVYDPNGLLAAGQTLNGLNTAASNNVVPTLAIEYFFTPNISLETICCVSGHHVYATSPAGLAGVNLVDNAQVIPATFTVKYHFTGLPGGIQPYIGVGPSLFIWINDRPSAALQAGIPGSVNMAALGIARSALVAGNVAAVPGITRTKLSSNVGVALQAGFDIPVGHGYGISLDAKKYLMDTTAHFYAGSLGDALDARLRLNPWIVSAGVSYRF
jgi:outer membrane protein